MYTRLERTIHPLPTNHLKGGEANAQFSLDGDLPIRSHLDSGVLDGQHLFLGVELEHEIAGRFALLRNSDLGRGSSQTQNHNPLEPVIRRECALGVCACAHEHPVGVIVLTIGKVALLVVVAAAVVDEEVPLRHILAIECHPEGVRVIDLERAVPPWAWLQGQNATPPLIGHNGVRVDGQIECGGPNHFVVGEEVVPALAGEVDLLLSGALVIYRVNQYIPANEITIIHAEGLVVLGVLPPQGPDNEGAVDVALVEQRVPDWQHGIADLDGGPDACHVLLPKHPRLTSVCIEVGVGAEEGIEDTGLVPTGHKLGLGVAKEPPHIHSDERHACDGHGEKHLGGHTEVVPLGCIVSRPDGTVPLCAGKECTGEDKRSLLVVGPTNQTLGSGPVDKHAVDVVDVSVLKVFGVFGILVHGYLGAIEHRGLIHVVPHVKNTGGSLVVLQGELIPPELTHILPGEIEPRRRPRPAPAIVLPPVLVLNVEALLLGLLVDVVAVVSLDVWVNDVDKLAGLVAQLLLHGDWLLEVGRVPRKVSLVVRVLNVEPDDVIRNVVLVKLLVHRQHIIDIVVIPAALMVGKTELGWHVRGARELRVLLAHIVRLGPEEHKGIDNSALRNPVGVLAHGGTILLHIQDIDPRLSGIEPEHAHGVACRVGHQVGDRSIQGHGVVEFKLKHIKVV
eukprot:comp22104_c0_seq1/m.32270 comp22104_c0_seq1/g.32270  ORF comp22104_c0_seq1/g.32270 comp22104_c0_seq1/m.32270 type:complete len:677 (+) comp22104_c0_seq1:115-2145(+)